ncbi:MAG: enoyl-CoA hydratase/isomerase family protein [Alphaproteobacteria bacterium]|jgi:methylglutaconyl-CoA hydratase|nr:enoyl-CoA hydratase/isomerase family protein [Alphaproteobacteria bacterium]
MTGSSPPVEPAYTDPLVEGRDSNALSSFVRLEATAQGAATVWINRPERKNAFDEEVIGALDQAFETLEAADGVRVVFVRGAGGSFCAGADLDWMRRAAQFSEADNRSDAQALAKMLKRLHDLPMLTVALVEGAAFGGGAGLVAACDMALATRDARFAFSEVKLGLVAATISPYVVRAIGPRRARALFALGRAFDAEAAQAYGLVDAVVADAGALEAARDALAAEATLAGPAAAAESKRLVEHVAGRHLDAGLMSDTAHWIARVRGSAEGREGVAAFLERRAPSWRS